MKEKLLLAAASLLGFATACENKRTVDMYGTPYFDYKVKGKVTDKEGAPVKGIEVGSQDAGPVTSESDGSYELSGREWSFRQTTLTFTDIDGYWAPPTPTSSITPASPPATTTAPSGPTRTSPGRSFP